MNTTEKTKEEYTYHSSEIPNFMEHNDQQKPKCWATPFFIPLLIGAAVYFVCNAIAAIAG